MPDPIIQTPPVTSPTVQATDAMVGIVASLVGGENDPQARADAITALDRAADRMNMAGVYLWRRQSNTWSASGSGDNDLTTGDTTLTKPADWGWPTREAIIRDSNSNVIGRPKWVMWDLFTRRLKAPNNAIPSLLSMRSELEDEIYIWPYIDTAALDTIELFYLGRIQRPSETTTMLLQPETREALITGGQFFLTQYRYLQRPAIWRPMQDDFHLTIAGAKAAADRWTVATQHAIIPDLEGSYEELYSSSGSYTPGQVYIKFGA